MKFLLFDREENYIRNLENVTLAKHSEEINGEDVFELEIAGNTDIKKGYRIVYKSKYGYWNEFIVKEIEKSRTDTLVTRLFCESSFYETLGDFIEDKRPTNSTATGALMVTLEPTRWEVGTVDNLGASSTNFYRISSKEAVQKVAEAWKGEIRTRVIVSGNKITHRYVDLLLKRGNDLGKRFTYTKDLESVTKIIHRDDVITALYGYGKGEEVGDGYGRRINFSEINNGKAYVENLEALSIWGRPNGSTKSHVFGKVEFDDCEDKEELKILTEEKLEEVSKPLITYQANVIDLKAYGFEHEGVELGDTVVVIDKEFKPELRLKARVVKIIRDLLEDDNEIILGNFIPNIVDSWNEQQDYINNFRGKQGVWDRSNIIGDDGTINAQFLNNLVDELNTRMNSQGGYVFLSDDGKGLITTDKPTIEESTMAIQLLGGGFRISNSKLPNGEFDWRTFGDGNGFIADSFIGGLLKGGKVEFDLTNGTLLIGNSPNDYNLYFDGNTLKIMFSNGKTIEEEIAGISSRVATLVADISGWDFDFATEEYVQGELGRELKEYHEHIKFKRNEDDVVGIHLYASNSDNRLEITKDKINFGIADNEDVAYFSNDKLHVTNVEIKEEGSLQLGQFSFVPAKDGSLAFGRF